MTLVKSDMWNDKAFDKAVKALPALYGTEEIKAQDKIIQEAIDNPNQFCEGHIAEPTQDAIKAIMGILRASKNPNNRFFISKVDGHLISSAYLNSSDGSYFPSIPKGSYELGAGKKQSRSYAILGDHLHQTWIEAARQEVA